VDALWPSPVSLTDIVAVLGFLVALVGLGMNTFQVRMLVRQLRLDASIRLTDSNRRVVSVAIERPELWEAIQIAEPRSSHDGFRRDRLIQLWLNHTLMVWKCHQNGMLEADDWEACCRDTRAFMELPAVREEWLRVRDFYPREFQREVARVSNGAVTAAVGP
jgi:hypothetical protein